jgi:hypothetical protein
MDPFVIDGHDLPYNTNSRFSQNERTYLNHAQVSDVSIELLYIWLVLTRLSVHLSTFKLCTIGYYDCLS